jgi:SOS-response transcriptional repressor LexA
MPESVRPTKKQQELLLYIRDFIAEHGYSPSYREIMKGCNYTSVATVALHVQSLIARGHLVKRGRSARSLEVTNAHIENLLESDITADESKWLVDRIDLKFSEAENTKAPTQKSIDELYVLVGSLKVLGLDGAATSFMPRLKKLRGSKVS